MHSHGGSGRWQGFRNVAELLGKVFDCARFALHRFGEPLNFGIVAGSFARARLTAPHARLARHSSLASAPAVLQGPGHGRIPSSMGAPARAERLLRDGEVAG